MTIQTEKTALVKRLPDTDDETVLSQVKEIFENKEKTFSMICQTMLNNSKFKTWRNFAAYPKTHSAGVAFHNIKSNSFSHND